MSSITGLISSGGGAAAATHIITDPKKFNKYGIGALSWKTASATSVDSRTAAPDTSVAHIASNTAASSNTYVTLLDVTSSNGGYLHWVLSCGINTLLETATIKITVDGGTPVELTYQPPAITAFGTARMFLGGGIATRIHTTASGVSGSQYDNWNSYNALGISTSSPHGATQYDDSTNNVYGIGYGFAYLQSDLAVLSDMPYQRLQFGNTIKVEAKMSTYTTTNLANYSYCYYSLF